MSFKRLIIQLFLISICLFSLKLSAQSYHFRNYSVEHGLPFIQVSAIFQDSKGNLWSGAYGGLSKYDGISFTNFGTKNGLVNHSVTAITEDKAGNLWIGTIDGLSKFDGTRFTNYNTKSGLTNNYISSLIVDKEGVLWIGTRKGLCYIKDNTFYSLGTKDGLPSNNILSLCLSDKDLMVGTSAGLTIYNKKDFKNYTTKDGLADSIITHIAKSADGTVWLGTATGLIEFKNEVFKLYSLGKEKQASGITALLIDKSNNIWIGTSAGLIQFTKEKSDIYKLNKESNSQIIFSLCSDFENNLWIGTNSGLYKYRGPLFINFTEKDGLASNFVFQIMRDKKGTLWFGSEKGLHSYNGKAIKCYGKKEGLGGLNVWAVVEDGDYLWLGTDAGVSRFDGKSFKNFTVKDGLKSNNCLTIGRDKTGILWFGGKGGVTKYDGKKFTSYTFEPLTKEYDIASFLQDKKGNIWFGAYQGGIYKSDGNAFKEAGKEIGISSNSFMSIIEDDKGKIYFGTFDGTFIYDGKTVVNINENKGLSSDLVYVQTLGVNKDELWIGTNQGLNKLKLETYKSAKPSIDHFGKEEGFVGVECNSNAAFHDADGSIWFGTVNGLIRYFPSALSTNRIEPKTAITSLSLFYKDTLLAQGTELHYSSNNITFRYAGISLTNPEKVRYQYKLQGFDKEWSPISKTNYTTYSNLPPGKYTFLVKAANNEGVWNKQPASFTFSIARPFWKTWWFWTSVFAVTVITFILAVRYRINQVKLKEREILQRNIQLASNELKALRAQMNPHFIFNSLNSIQHFIMSSDDVAASKYLNKFAKLIRIILNNSEKPVVSIREEVEALKLYLELEALRFDNKFDYEISIDENIDMDNYEVPAMLIQPYVENAILHGLNPKIEKGNLVIRIEEQNNFIVCRIHDDGIGRKKAGEIKERSMSKNQISLGTKITTDRLALLNQLHHSSLSVKIKDLVSADNNSAGTEVEIYIPL